MELLAWAWDLAVHLDAHLAAFVDEHGPWVYALLFLIVFLLDLFGFHTNPYVGIVFFLVMIRIAWKRNGYDDRAGFAEVGEPRSQHNREVAELGAPD